MLCDRGIASPKLWRQIRAQGWHPYMRYRKNVSAQDGRRLPAQHFVSRPDTAWIGCGTAFSAPNAKRRCTLPGYRAEEPWIILTDLPPEDAGPSWYALRFWIELGFKAVKSRAGSGTRPEGPIRRGSPATGWCCRWRRCWPWPMAKTPMTAAGRRIPGAATPRAGRYGPSASSATASTGCRLLLRGRLWSRLLPNLRTQAQPGDYSAMPLRENLIPPRWERERDGTTGDGAIYLPREHSPLSSPQSSWW